MQNSITAMVLSIPGKIPLKLGTGLLGNHFTIDARFQELAAMDILTGQLQSEIFLC